MPGSHHVNINNVTKKYKSGQSELLLFESLSLAIPTSQRIAIVGPNGSGKSTLLKIILGLINPEDGDISYSNNYKFSETSYIPQDYRNALFPWLKLDKNISLYQKQKYNETYFIKSNSALKEFIEITKQLGNQFDLHKYPYQFSGGEQQIIVLIQALLKNPKLFIADEPLSAVDLNKKELILNFLNNWLNIHNPTVILVSHDLDDAIFLSDRVIILSRNSSSIIADMIIEKNQPRKLEWRYSLEFRNIVKKIIDSIK